MNPLEIYHTGYVKSGNHQERPAHDEETQFKLHCRLDRELYERLKIRAHQENRSVNGQLRQLLIEHL